METSILTTIKKHLGIDEEYDVFDLDIMIHINSAFSTLTQLGVGPESGYEISGSENRWEEFVEDNKQLNSVRTYIYLKVRLLFDPPSTSFAIESLKKQQEELEWRLNVSQDTREEFLSTTE